jgi:hypothetical protein
VCDFSMIENGQIILQVILKYARIRCCNFFPAPVLIYGHLSTGYILCTAQYYKQILKHTHTRINVIFWVLITVGMVIIPLQTAELPIPR